MKVSVLIITFNEEAMLPVCLAALAWCDDVVVLDSGSTDGTREIAEVHGARVLVRAFDTFSSQRNYGLEAADFKYEWVLHLDADEVTTPAFHEKLLALVAVDGIDAYQVPSKTILHEHWLRHAGMYPVYQVRLGHRDRLRFKQVGHGQRENLPPSRVGLFCEPYEHHSFSHGLAHWLRKHIKYARDEALLIASEQAKADLSAPSLFTRDATSRRRALKHLANRIPFALRPFARFFYVLFWRRGFLDGRYGVLYALMLSVYEGMIGIFAYDAMLSRRKPEGKAARERAP